MNKGLKNREEQMFKDIYGEEELAKAKSLPKVKIPEEYSENPPKRLRFEIDKRNNKSSSI